MKIDELVQLLKNRLKEFQLSRDYARMRGDLDKMNAAEKEVLDLEDTIFQLNILLDTSKSAEVNQVILTDAITDGSTTVLDEYDITVYATDPLHERKVMTILSKMGPMDTVEQIDKYIKSKYFGSPVTGQMIMNASEAFSVDTRMIMAMIEQDSSFGTAGKAVRTRNPGNVGNDDSGNLQYYDSWQEGVTAVAAWLNRHRGSTIIAPLPDPEPEPELDTTAPVISNMSVVTTMSTATITWTTDENATSQVEYATESLASASTIEMVSDAALLLEHTIEITGLTAATQYFYRVTSVDEAGNMSTSDEMTLETSPDPEPDPDPEPEPDSDPDPTATSTPPIITPDPDPDPDPTATSTPPIITPDPDPDPTATSTPPIITPDPDPDPTATSTSPIITPDPEPDPTATSTPPIITPDTDPEPDPDPDPEPDSESDETPVSEPPEGATRGPVPGTETEFVPVTDPDPDPDPEPESEPDTSTKEPS